MEKTMSCPKCNYSSSTEEFNVCPKCGVIVKKYFETQGMRLRMEEERLKKRRQAEEQKMITSWGKILWGTDRLSQFIRVVIALLLSAVVFAVYLELTMSRKADRPENIVYEGEKESNSSNTQLSSLEDSINFLLKKFPEFILDARDDGASVSIKLKDSFWYNLTYSQRQQFADRTLDVIYASGDVKKILYIQDEHSRVVAEQHLEKVGPGLIRQPYMDLK